VPPPLTGKGWGVWGISSNRGHWFPKKKTEKKEREIGRGKFRGTRKCRKPKQSEERRGKEVSLKVWREVFLFENLVGGHKSPHYPLCLGGPKWGSACVNMGKAKKAGLLGRAGQYKN